MSRGLYHEFPACPMCLSNKTMKLQVLVGQALIATWWQCECQPKANPHLPKESHFTFCPDLHHKDHRKPCAICKRGWVRI